VSLPASAATGPKNTGPLAVDSVRLSQQRSWDEYFGCKLSHGTPFPPVAIEERIDPGTHFFPASWGLRGPGFHGEDDFLIFAPEAQGKHDTAEEFHEGRDHCISAKQPAGISRQACSNITLDIELCGNPAYAPLARGRRKWVYSPARKKCLKLVLGVCRGLKIVVANLGGSFAPPLNDNGGITALLAANLSLLRICCGASKMTGLAPQA